MQEGKKRIGMLRQLAILFAVGVVLIGLMTSLALYSVSQTLVKNSFTTLGHGAAGEVESYINQFPAHEWLMRYWYENYDKLDIEYDASYGADTDTAAKVRKMTALHPEFEPEYAQTADVEALPPEDQKLYAEIVYSWLITRINVIAVNSELDYLFGVVAQEPYDKAFILFIASKNDLERGPETGKLYPIGSVFTVTDTQQSAMESVVGGTPQIASNEDGKYRDYFYSIGSFDDHNVLIGVTRNIWVINRTIREHTFRLSALTAIFLILQAIACLTMVLLYILSPLKRVQENIRFYKHTKNSKRIIADLSEVQSRNEIGELSEDVIELTREIDSYTNEIEKISSEKERINTELTLASNIQMSMMPGNFPAFPGRSDFDVYAAFKPAREVGGDFYDFFLLDDDHLALVIADVSGKGVPAALFVMATKITLSHLFRMGKSPAEILTDTNETINSNNPQQMFVTIWLGILDLKTGKLTAANAGHEYPVIRNAGGSFELFKDKHGFVVGSMPDMIYKEYELQLEPGSCLFLYSDGLPEATDASLEMFGTDRIVECLNRKPDGSPEELIETMNEAVSGFVRDAEQFDDLTMMCVVYNG